VLADLLARLDAREVSSVELVDEALAKIAASPLGAFRVVRDDAARAEAAEADRRRAAGESGALLGVPVAVKDDMDVAGETTPFGCGGDWPVLETDSEAPRRLRAAGAVIVGKTTTPELGQWPFTEGPAFGVTRNPWNLDHSPGGSSGGSAAAVAAGLVPVALGSDGAGSVRIPAAWTHLVGIKPQRGRVSTWPDPEAFNGITCIGPLARTVDDAARLLDAVAGNRFGDKHTPPPPEEPYAQAAQRNPGRLRIALSFRIPFSGARARLDADVRARVERLARVLEGLGHEIIEADPAYDLIGVPFMCRSTPALHKWIDRHPDPSVLDPRTRHNVAVGRLLSPLTGAAKALDPVLQRRVGAIFKRADVVLAPTTAQPPLKIGAAEGKSSWGTDQVIVGACPYAWPFNVLGWPAINVPAGFTPGKLPVGAQLIGPANSEGRLLSLAAQLEQVERWFDHEPPQLPPAG
jgi:amidase